MRLHLERLASLVRNAFSLGAFSAFKRIYCDLDNGAHSQPLMTYRDEAIGIEVFVGLPSVQLFLRLQPDSQVQLLESACCKECCNERLYAPRNSSTYSVSSIRFYPGVSGVPSTDWLDVRPSKLGRKCVVPAVYFNTENNS